MQDSSTDRTVQLHRYISRGWALVPLHDVSSGVCSCGAGTYPEHRSAGKHPRGSDWQRPEHLVRDEAGLTAALERWPSSNWGLATGLISGVWALDYDPAHVDPAQATDVARVLADCWATATWVQRTGSGGLHFLFSLPEDFVPNNGSGQLPKGFDVRGARRGESGGGQIVLAPSVSGVGAYEVLQDRPVTSAPGVVLEAVRPAPPRAHRTPVPLATQNQNAVTRYVVAAVAGELHELRECRTGRNQRAWRAAARCIEMVNTGVFGAQGESVYAAWWAAGLAHPDPAVHVPDVELLRVWASAERHVGDRPADLSGVGGPSGWGGDSIHFAGAPAATPSLGGGPGAGTAGASSYPQGVDGGVDNGRTAQDIAGQGPDSDPVTAMISRMLTAEQLDERPNPEPLINGVLDMSSCVWLIGQAGSFKSFVALDWAAHVGLGREWRGHRVRQGLVIYVVAEGDRGMKLRQAAWRREHGEAMKDVLFLPEPVQADERRRPGEGGWSVLVEACRRLQPVLVIIDTQARVTIGLKENDNSDMSYYAEQADRIKRVTGACVLTVHHMGRKGDDARGASSIDGAQDAEIKVVRKGKGLTFDLVTDKQKDQVEAAQMTLTMRRSEGGNDPVSGRDLSSLIIDHAEVPVLADGGMPINLGVRRAIAAYCTMRDEFNLGDGGTKTEIAKVVGAHVEWAGLRLTRGEGMSAAGHKAWQRAWQLLVSLGLVIKRGTKFKILVLDDMGAAGFLTPNDGTDAPAGWSIWWPDDEQAAEHGKKSLERVAQQARDKR